MVVVLDEDIIEAISSHHFLLARINHLLAFNRAYYQHQISLQQQRFWINLSLRKFNGNDESYDTLKI